MVSYDRGASPASTPVIRLFHPDDQVGIRALHDRTPPSGGIANDLPQPWPSDLDEIGKRFAAFWVATIDDQIVGMVGLRKVDDQIPDRMLGEKAERDATIRLLRMRIAPEWQRQGIGSRLVETTLRWAREEGYRTMILETTVQQVAAVALYHQHGFRDIGTSPLGPYVLLWMQRPLDASPHP